MNELLRRLLYLFRKKQFDRDLEEEMRFHLEMSGSGPRHFGNPTLLKEVSRDAWSFTTIETFFQDLRYGIRMLRKSPGFSTVAVLSLALGIGANTAIFSLIDALLLRMLPVRDPHQLVEVMLIENGRRGDSFSYPVVHALQETRHIFSGLCGFSGASFNASVDGAIQRTSGAWVSGEYYDTLGLQPVLGRLLRPEDDQPGAAPVAVIGYGYWERQFGRDPAVLGKTILLDGSPVTVVGVSPPGFTGANVGQVSDITVPFAILPQLAPERASRLEATSQWLRILARPQPNVSITQAKARLAVLWPQIAAEHAVTTWTPPERRRVLLASRLDLAPGGTGWTSLREQFSRPLFVLMAIVGLVLLIACSNVANLLLARASSRQKEIAVRLAIGAGRGRLLRQLLTESVLLSSIGGALGILFAYAGSHFLLYLMSTGRVDPIALDLQPDLQVLGFTTVIALATGLLFGLAPAFRATARGPALRASRSHLGPALMVFQVALSLVLLVGAGLFVRTLRNLERLNAGFRHEGILLIDLDPRRQGYRNARLAALYQELLEAFERVPGVKAVSLSGNTPLSGGIWSDAVLIDGHVPLSGRRPSAHFNDVAPRYFEVLGTPLVLGRDFTLRDNAAAPSVAIVNEEFVRRYIPDRRGLGRHVSVPRDPSGKNREIVGIVRNAVSFSLREPPPPTVYIPYFQNAREMSGPTFELYAAGSLATVAAEVRNDLHSRLPQTPFQLRPFTAQVNRALIQERLIATLASFFGLLALGLSAVGLYGLMSYLVARRTSEIGIRMALGAGRLHVFRLVLGNGMRLIGVGMLAGLIGALASVRMISTMLFGLTAADPITLAGASVVLVTVAAIAALLPARRASRVDPMVALRYE